MMRSFLKLIRWPNLLIIVASMVLLMFLMIRPGLRLAAGTGMTPEMYWLLVAAVVFTAIGGYVVNDLKDLPSDKVNKPGKNVFEQHYPEKTGWILYGIFTLAGILTGSILSFQLGKGTYALIFVLTAGLLWFYSVRYECQPLVGNLVVAFLSALSFGLVWLYELLALQMHSVVVDHSRLLLVNNLVLVYMGFAFLVSLLREVVKDVEDEKGDRQTGCLTFPVTYGVARAKNLSIAVNVLGLLASFVMQWLFYQWHFIYLFLYFFLIDLLFAFVLLKLTVADDKNDFKTLSLWIKLLMVAGILSMALFYFE
jgi:4-hydroxybenzoate polyprenyltransferase